MKIYAMYLPQFHTFKENDEWWGKGFTEWVNTKKAKPLYKNHYQPKTPLNNNYYNLLNDSTMEEQAKLAKKYGIDGFIFYHYWFNGKLLMEKPVENMLKNKKVKIDYCFSWANEPWTRSWDGKSKEIIMPQNYGNELDWIKHYDYLKDFFHDDRYIKINNMPVLFIYRMNSIKNFENMMKCFDYEAKKDGFDGIYIVETLTAFQTNPISKFSKAVYLFEPMYTESNEYDKKCRLINSIKKIIPSLYKGYKYALTNDYDMICKKIIKRNISFDNKSLFLGMFPGWDNTARKGKKASIVEGNTPEKFGYYLDKLSDKNIPIIINAWNEWAEGAYLEPDIKNQYAYLEKIKEVKTKYDKK